ncbi:hypothetical protein ACFVW2_36825, partial [Streptomyces sp. NPDC058171]
GLWESSSSVVEVTSGDVAVHGGDGGGPFPAVPVEEEPEATTRCGAPVAATAPSSLIAIPFPAQRI